MAAMGGYVGTVAITCAQGITEGDCTTIGQTLGSEWIITYVDATTCTATNAPFIDYAMLDTSYEEYDDSGRWSWKLHKYRKLTAQQSVTQRLFTRRTGMSYCQRRREKRKMFVQNIK